MANDFAKIKRDIWNDVEWRRCSRDGQWLYMMLLSAPSLTFAGVADWRPPRIAPLAAGTTPDDVIRMSAEMIQGRFILPDFDTEEVLIRSWVKHDGLMKQQNMAKALHKAWGRTASNVLRGVIVAELNRLYDADPTLTGWDFVGDLLNEEAFTFDEAVGMVMPNPSGNPSDHPSHDSSDDPTDSDSNPSDHPSEIRRPLLTTSYSLPPTSYITGSPSQVCHQRRVGFQGSGDGGIASTAPSAAGSRDGDDAYGGSSSWGV